MAEHPTVTTPGGSDLFASLSSIDYSSFSDESMAMLVEDNLASTTTATPSSTQPLRTGLTPGGGNTDNFLMTPRTAEFMAELGGAMATPMNNHHQTHPTTTADARLEMLFDHELVTSGLPSTDALPATTASSEDLPTPLNFSFTPTGSSGGVPRYHAAPTHKHKRVRSNPDMLQGLSFQQLLGNGNTTVSQAGSSPLRPSVDSMASQHHSVSLPTTPMDSNVPMPEPLPISIGTVNVVTPVGFHGGATPGNNGGGEDAFPSDMVSFLKEMQWSELTENNTNSMNMDAMYAQQRGIAGGLNDLKMKRKRPTQHTRHHSNPVDLLHNLDQFRMMSQQQQLQQQQQQPATIDPMPFQPTVKMDQSASMMAPNPFEMPQQGQNMQFQVPSQIANGTARSLHNRRSSMPNSAFARGHARRNTAGHSTGLSMDMSQMNLSFLSLPEEEFQQQLQDQRQQQAFQQAMGGGFPPRSNSPLLPQQNSPPQRGSKKAVGGNAFGMDMDSESMRKSYKCGRCGQPKVGHVCTMPELRNNWTQVDLEVTKGTKLLRMNCQIVATKSKWIPQHEDNM